MELEDCKALTDAIENAYDLKIEGYDQWSIMHYDLNNSYTALIFNINI